MSVKIKFKEETSKMNLQNRTDPQGFSQEDPSPGFHVVAIGLVAYIFYAGKLISFTWLYPIALVLIVFGFVLLILET